MYNKKKQKALKELVFSLIKQESTFVELYPFVLLKPTDSYEAINVNFLTKKPAKINEYLILDFADDNQVTIIFNVKVIFNYSINLFFYKFEQKLRDLLKKDFNLELQNLKLNIIDIEDNN